MSVWMRHSSTKNSSSSRSYIRRLFASSLHGSSSSSHSRARTTTTSLALFFLASNSISTTTTTTTTAYAFATPSTVLSSSSSRRFSVTSMEALAVVHKEDNEEDNDDPLLEMTGYLSSINAASLDVELMSQPGFSLEQLMELAGLSVAEAAYNYLLLLPLNNRENHSSTTITDIIIVCGPGNNGGDGLVAARHLFHFGYRDVCVVYPKRPRNDNTSHFDNLVVQCEALGIPVLDNVPEDSNDTDNDTTTTTTTLFIDAIFGFSFRGSAPREPYLSILNRMQTLQREGRAMILSVDVPSGWHVDNGIIIDDDDDDDVSFYPEALVSLTSPKLCSKHFRGRHFVGGRFLPDHLAKKYGIKMPPYPGTSQVMEVPTLHQKQNKNDYDWAEEYQRHSYEKEQQSNHKNDNPSTLSSSGKEDTDNEDEDDWAAAYAKHCQEKEHDMNENPSTSLSGREDTDNDDEADWAAAYAKHCQEKEHDDDDQV